MTEGDPQEGHRISPVTGKTIVVEVRDDEFAAALSSVGIPFADPAKPFTLLEHGDGTRTAMWRFAPKSEDGKLSTQPLLKAQKDPLAWIAKNPQHPFAYALADMLNQRRFRLAVEQSRPLVGFRLSAGRTIYVFKDSRKARKLARLGARRV